MIFTFVTSLRIWCAFALRMRHIYTETHTRVCNIFHVRKTSLAVGFFFLEYSRMNFRLCVAMFHVKCTHTHYCLYILLGKMFARAMLDIKMFVHVVRTVYVRMCHIESAERTKYDTKWLVNICNVLSRVRAFFFLLARSNAGVAVYVKKHIYKDFLHRSNKCFLYKIYMRLASIYKEISKLRNNILQNTARAMCA